MTYSCSDFTDDILRELDITVPEDDLNDPAIQATMACEEIDRLQKAEKDGIDARQLLADLWAESARHLLEKDPATFIRLRDQVQKMNLPQPTIPF